MQLNFHDSIVREAMLCEWNCTGQTADLYCTYASYRFYMCKTYKDADMGLVSSEGLNPVPELLQTVLWSACDSNALLFTEV